MAESELSLLIEQLRRTIGRDPLMGDRPITQAEARLWAKAGPTE